MIIQVTNVNMRYAEGELDSVQVFFTGRNEDGSINISGYIPLSAEEYAGNESVPTLTALVKNKVIEKLSPSE
jgi:hypothetical protein